MEDLDWRTILFTFITLTAIVLKEFVLQTILFSPFIYELIGDFVPNSLIFISSQVGFLLLILYLGTKMYSDNLKSLILYNNRAKMRLFVVFYVTQLVIVTAIILLGPMWISLSKQVSSRSLGHNLLLSLVTLTGHGDLMLSVANRSFTGNQELSFQIIFEIATENLLELIYVCFGLIATFAWLTLDQKGEAETYPRSNQV